MRRAGLVLVVVLLATTIAPSGLGATPPIRAGSTNYELVIESAGGGATPLARAGVLPSDEAIFVAPSQGILQVRYYLDPSARNLELRSLGGRPGAVATASPFDLAGWGALGAKASTAGPHTLVAAIDLADGRTVLTTARVRVSNGGRELSVEPAAAAPQAGTPFADCTPLNCSQVKVTAPYVLTFDGDRGGLVDKNGVGTGFTWVDKPTGPGTGYIPANLVVNPVASTLSITTTAGIAFLGENNQDNALGVGIDAANQVSILETKLVNLPPMSGNLEQAGLWYGNDDNNYLKLVLISDPSGPLVQFMEERGGILQQQVVTGTLQVTGATVLLRLRADPVQQTVTAYYGLNDGALVELKTLTVPPGLFNQAGAIDPALGTRVFGGIFATDRFLQGVTVYQFDYFDLTAEGQVQRIYLPAVMRQ